MANIPVSTINYFEGMAEAYAETVARVGKPLSSFEITYDTTSENRKTIDNFVKNIKDKAEFYKIKCYVIRNKSYIKDLKGKNFTKPNTEFIYYKDKKVLKEYLDIHGKSELSSKDHKRLGKIFGYSSEAVQCFLKEN